MEDILDVYQRPRDPECPMVRVDESSKQRIAETRVPIAAKPGRAARYDCEYRRNGTANLFIMFAPLAGWRHVKVTGCHTVLDYAQVRKELADPHFPNATKIVLVQHNLNTHKPASLYEAFLPPRHCGSWNGSSGATRPNMGVGWIWLNPNSVFCRSSASIGKSRIGKC
jgi:hypothetical protein